MGSNASALDSHEIAETPLARVVREQGRLKGWLAEQIGISPYRLARLLSGERALTLAEAATAARVLDVPIDTFIPEARDGR